MTVQTRVLENPVSKERITFLRTGADTGGELFRFEVVAPPDMVPPPAHMHAGEEERLEVLQGELTAQVAGRQQGVVGGQVLVQVLNGGVRLAQGGRQQPQLGLGF